VLRFASLGSGSEGNGLLIECRDGDRRVRLLIDCGFGIREARRRLERLGLAPADLDAILVTHEHGDHIGGVFRLAQDAAAPVYVTRGTLRRAPVSGASAWRDARGEPRADVRLIDPGQVWEVGGVRIEPVAVPHDAGEPVQYVVDCGGCRLGVLTDLGHATAHVVRSFSRLDALVLESNHDSRMLADSDYPSSLKRRIAGPYGHLSNDAAAQMLARLDHDRLRSVTAAHLSQRNNAPELACAALSRGWGVQIDQIRLADQQQGIDWLDI